MMRNTTYPFSFYKKKRWIPTQWKMMRKCKMNGCNLSIILRSIKQKILQLQYQQNQYPQKQQYPLQRGVGIQDIFHETVKVLQQNVNIVKHLIRLLNSFRSLLLNGRIELSLTPTRCRIWIQTPIWVFKWLLQNPENYSLLQSQEEVLWWEKTKIHNKDNRRWYLKHKINLC